MVDGVVGFLLGLMVCPVFVCCLCWKWNAKAVTITIEDAGAGKLY